MRNYICILLIVVFTFFGAAAVQAESSDNGGLVEIPNLTLRILTFNIHSALNWNGEYDLEGIINFIREVNPDLVGLQEVERFWSSASNFQDLPAEMASRLNMFYAYSVSLERDNGYFGNLILSKYPITQIWTENLPGSLEKRSLAFTQLFVKGARINFLTTHLGLSLEDRQEQITSILQFVNQVNGPLIITGDFNGIPQESSISLLCSNFLDLQERSEVKENGTFRLKEGNIGSRIDYILTTPDFGLSSFRIYNDNYLSDHLPVVTEVSLTVDPENVAGEPLYQASN